MKTVYWILIIISVSVPIILLMVIGGHDLSIQQKYVDDLEAQFYHNVNNTASCPDLKDWIDHGKDFWIKSDRYNTFVTLYAQNNCDEVLKK